MSLLLFCQSTEYFVQLLGNADHWLINDIIHFGLTTSVFDLVIIALCKLILLVILLTELETRVIINLSRPMIRSTFSYIRSISIITLVILTVGSFIFAITKLVLVLRNLHLNQLNLACVYIFLILSILEMLGSVKIIPYLTQLKLLEQKQVTDPVDISRVLSLIKPERSLIIAGSLFLFITSSTQIVDVIFFGKIIGDALTGESMDSVNRNIIILLCIDFVGSVAEFLHSWLYALAGQ